MKQVVVSLLLRLLYAKIALEIFIREDFLHE